MKQKIPDWLKAGMEIQVVLKPFIVLNKQENKDGKYGVITLIHATS
jgi:hypothetical protein